MKPQLTPELVDEMARIFRALSVSSRLMILSRLKDAEQNVGALVEALGMTQANVSKHLRVLRDAGLVKDRQQGARVYYSLAGPFVMELCEVVCEGFGPILATRARRFAAFTHHD